MPEIISPVNLLVDEENPRLLHPNVGQHKAIQALANVQGKKLLMLARDIIHYGLNPSELCIVMAHERDPGRFIVLEGNRRLTALRALENPELLANVVEGKVLREMRKLSHTYQENPIEGVECVVVKDRALADHWLEVRHSGEGLGAGIVQWDSDERARHRGRTRKLEIHQQALDFLDQRGDLSPEQRAAVPSSTFKRLLETPYVRSKLALEVQDGNLCLLADADKIVAALLYITSDLASKDIKVRDVYTKDQRIEYADALPAHVVVTPTLASGGGVDVNTGETQQKRTRAQRASIPRERTHLIPGDCVLSVTDPRCHDIERELRLLSLSQYHNAVSVLFRVFLELSVGAYIDSRSITIDPRSKLKDKVAAVIPDLVSRTKLAPDQARAAKNATRPNTFLAASTTTLNDYVHSRYLFPSPADLRAGWDSLQPFITAIWSA